VRLIHSPRFALILHCFPLNKTHQISNNDHDSVYLKCW